MKSTKLHSKKLSAWFARNSKWISVQVSVSGASKAVTKVGK